MEKEALLGSLAKVTAPSGCESAAAAWIRDNLEKFCEGFNLNCYIRFQNPLSALFELFSIHTQIGQVFP